MPTMKLTQIAVDKLSPPKNGRLNFSTLIFRGSVCASLKPATRPGWCSTESGVDSAAAPSGHWPPTPRWILLESGRGRS